MAKISTNAEINSVRLKEQASAPDTPASGYFQVYAKDDGKLYCKNDAGTEICLSEALSNPMTAAGDMIYGGESGVPTRLEKGTAGHFLKQGATNPEWALGGNVKIAMVKRNSNAADGNDYAISNGSWAAVDSTNLVLTIPAVTGDILGVGVNGSWSGNAYVALSAATIVSAAIVSYIDTGTSTPGTNGVQGWADSDNAASPGSGQMISGEFLYTVQAGDIDSGNVVLHLYAKAFAAGKVILCRSGFPLLFYVKNYGQGT